MITDTIASLHDPRRAFVPPSLAKSKEKDRIWIASKALLKEKIPMWMGWNVKFSQDNDLPMQQICYLPQINQSPTSNAVVVKTMVGLYAAVIRFPFNYILPAFIRLLTGNG